MRDKQRVEILGWLLQLALMGAKSFLWRKFYTNMHIFIGVLSGWLQDSHQMQWSCPREQMSEGAM